MKVLEIINNSKGPGIRLYSSANKIEQLYACRAALRDCLEQMERTPRSAISPDFIAAIDDGRKALGEE